MFNLWFKLTKKKKLTKFTSHRYRSWGFYDKIKTSKI